MSWRRHIEMKKNMSHVQGLEVTLWAHQHHAKQPTDSMQVYCNMKIIYHRNRKIPISKLYMEL